MKGIFIPNTVPPPPCVACEELTLEAVPPFYIFTPLLFRTSVCSNNQVIYLTCKPKSCGKKITPRLTGNTFPLPHSLSYDVSSRVLGGRTARSETWPWIASLTLPGMRHICGSTLVHPQWLLSAAHCFQGYLDRKLFLGISYFEDYICL